MGEHRVQWENIGYSGRTEGTGGSVGEQRVQWVQWENTQNRGYKGYSGRTEGTVGEQSPYSQTKPESTKKKQSEL